jgi:hypothetical protein
MSGDVVNETAGASTPTLDEFCDPSARAAHYAMHEPRARSGAGAICARHVAHAAATPRPAQRGAPRAAEQGGRAVKRRPQPDALLHRGGTDFERRVLAAMATERPSSALRARMREGLGLISPPFTPLPERRWGQLELADKRGAPS